jgi:hypothetical protein
VGDERAETCLRLRAEAELRRVSAELRRADAAAGATPGVRADPSTMPFGAAEMAYWKVLRAGGSPVRGLRRVTLYLHGV